MSWNGFYGCFWEQDKTHIQQKICVCNKTNIIYLSDKNTHGRSNQYGGQENIWRLGARMAET